VIMLTNLKVEAIALVSAGARGGALDNSAPRFARGTKRDASLGRGGGHHKMLARREIL